MTFDTGTIIPRSQIRLAVEPLLRSSLGSVARGRMLVIDYYASRRCSLVVGDLTADLRNASPGPGYAELSSVEGVRVFADARLLELLRDAGANLRMAGPPFARHLAVSLDRPEQWIDFLEAPGVLAGKRGFRWR
jgi:hypothetical protein